MKGGGGARNTMLNSKVSNTKGRTSNYNSNRKEEEPKQCNNENYVFSFVE